MNGNIIFITGCAGNGKSTFRELLVETLANTHFRPRIASADMSDIINWCKNNPGTLGSEITSRIPFMRQGHLLDDSLVIQAFRIWSLAQIPKCPELQVVSGFPRSHEQLSFARSFNKWIIVHILADRKDSDESIRRRLQKSNGKIREDDNGGQEVMDTRWNEYTTMTRPALDSVIRNVAKLDRKVPLKQRLKHFLSEQLDHPESPIDYRVCLNALELLNTGSIHNVEAKIKTIES